MKRSFRVRIVLAFCIALGLLFAPMSVPAIAKSAGMQMSLTEMSGDMPCCPDAVDHKMPQDDGCKDCLLMAVCAFKTVQIMTSAALADFYPVLMVRLSPIDDMFADGHIGLPPARPPRSLV